MESKQKRTWGGVQCSSEGMNIIIIIETLINRLSTAIKYCTIEIMKL